jgi:hypothetical protein
LDNLIAIGYTSPDRDRYRPSAIMGLVMMAISHSIQLISLHGC